MGKVAVKLHARDFFLQLGDVFHKVSLRSKTLLDSEGKKAPEVTERDPSQSKT